MPFLTRLRVTLARVAGLWPRVRRDDDLDEEIRTHLEMAAMDNVRAGMSPAEARRSAMRELGGVEQAKESYRDQRSLPFIEGLMQDVRFAVRACAKAPAFTLAVILTLSVGIGGNTAMFTLANALLFRPLPGRAGELVGVFSYDRAKKNHRLFSYANYADIREQSDVFDGLLAHTFAFAAVPVGDTIRRAFAELVSSNYFETLGARPVAGRAFTAEEERPGAGRRVVIVGYEHWRKAGFDPALVGRTMRINGDDFTIVGVAPDGFTGTSAFVAPDMWLPLGMFDAMGDVMFTAKGLADRRSASLFVAGRLRAGLDAESAAVRLDVVGRRLESAYPEANRDHSLVLGPRSRHTFNASPATGHGTALFATTLLALSGAVLLIACLNIASMLLARGTARGKEIAIRLALGGGRGRVVRQLLTESFVLATGGALVGLALAYGALRLLLASLPSALPMTLHFDPSPDGRVLAATLAFAIASTLLFGLGPALKLSRLDLAGQMKETAAHPAARDGGRSRVRSALVVVQLALSVGLLAAGGHFARVALHATSTGPGFEYDGALLASVDPGLASYDETRGREAYRRLLEHVRRLPGVGAAGIASQVPFGDVNDGRQVDRPAAGTGSEKRQVGVSYAIVGADYFRALGLPMLRGREFTAIEEESANAAPVAIIDEPLAQRLFPGEDPVGQELRVVEGDSSGGDGKGGAILQIVGVARNVRDTLFVPEPYPHLYVPTGRGYRGSMYLHVKAARADRQSETALLTGMRRALRDVDERLPVLELTTMRSFHQQSLELWTMRAGEAIFGLFGLVALGLASTGIYGTKSYLVAQRTREIAIRMAVGASARNVLWLVFRRDLPLIGLGIAGGAALGILVTQLLGSVLWGPGSLDPVVLLGAPLVLTGATLVATYVPARRATKVTPLTALRAD